MTEVTPVKLLAAQVTAISNPVAWTIDDGGSPTDPWVGNPYRWTIAANVSAQTHSSNRTRAAFLYTGNDIAVGDWMADLATASAVQIISITAQSDWQITCVVQDIDRFNTFTDGSSSGTGIGGFGPWYCFTLGADGLPILTPMSGGAGTLSQNVAFQQDIVGRFRARNLMKGYVEVTQAGHTFLVGDAIYLDSTNTYNLVDSAHTDSLIGFVSSIGIPGPTYFSYRSVGTVIANLSPSLPGNIGGLIYLDPTNNGKYTATKPAANSRAVFIKLSNTTGIQVEHATTTPPSITKSIKVTPTDGQTVFSLPVESQAVIEMSINGIETTSFTFTTPTLTIDPLVLGYAVEVTDEVIFVYTT